MESLLQCPMTEKEAELKNPLSLAYVGDTVWDLLVRQSLLRSSARVNALHRQAIERVNAGAQALAYLRLLPHLTQVEQSVASRGENAHARHAVPKNQDPVAYSRATALEAVIGYLYLTGQQQRILTLYRLATDADQEPQSKKNTNFD